VNGTPIRFEARGRPRSFTKFVPTRCEWSSVHARSDPSHQFHPSHPYHPSSLWLPRRASLATMTEGGTDRDGQGRMLRIAPRSHTTPHTTSRDDVVNGTPVSFVVSGRPRSFTKLISARCECSSASARSDQSHQFHPSYPHHPSSLCLPRRASPPPQ
jgi:hypothetical protein